MVKVKEPAGSVLASPAAAAAAPPAVAAAREEAAYEETSHQAGRPRRRKRVHHLLAMWAHAGKWVECGWPREAQCAAAAAAQTQASHTTAEPASPPAIQTKRKQSEPSCHPTTCLLLELVHLLIDGRLEPLCTQEGRSQPAGAEMGGRHSGATWLGIGHARPASQGTAGATLSLLCLAYKRLDEGRHNRVHRRRQLLHRDAAGRGCRGGRREGQGGLNNVGYGSGPAAERLRAWAGARRAGRAALRCAHEQPPAGTRRQLLMRPLPPSRTCVLQAASHRIPIRHVRLALPGERFQQRFAHPAAAGVAQRLR